jgi:hypothetical protein
VNPARVGLRRMGGPGSPASDEARTICVLEEADERAHAGGGAAARGMDGVDQWARHSLGGEDLHEAAVGHGEVDRAAEGTSGQRDRWAAIRASCAARTPARPRPSESIDDGAIARFSRTASIVPTRPRIRTRAT